MVTTRKVPALLITVLALAAPLPSQAEARDRSLVVGVYDNPPMSWMRDDEPDGLFIEPIRELEASGWSVEYRHGTWQALFEDVQAGRIDLLPVVAYSEARARVMALSSETVVANWGVICAASSLELGTIEDIRGRRVAMLDKDSHAQAFSSLLAAMGIGYEVLPVSSFADAALAVAEGRAEVGVFNHIFAVNALANAARSAGSETRASDPWLRLRETPLVFNPIQIRYAAPLGDPKGALRELDARIAALKLAGLWNERVDRWLRVETIPRTPAWVPYAVMAIALVALLSIAASSYLAHAVQRKTLALESTNRALAESDERHGAVLATAMDGFMLLDEDARILEVNETYCGMGGWTAEELLGRRIADIEASQGAAEIARRIARLKSRSQDRFETRHIRKDGTEYDVEVSVQYRAGEKGLLVAFIRDIGDRKRLEQRRSLAESEREAARKDLAEREEYLRAVVACLPLPMYSMDSDGQVLSWNEAAERSFGWSASEVLGRRLPTVDDASQQEFFELRQLLLRGHTIAGLELKRQRKDGRVLDIHLWAAPLYDAEGQVIGLLSIVEDVSEAKQAEDRLRRNLEEKQVLLKEIHHRVKNNLSVISSLLDLQSARITSPEEALRAFRNSRDRVAAMALVHRVLYESGDFARIDMKAYIERLCEQIARVYDGSGRVRIEVEIDNVSLELERAIPCGLMLNEFVTNGYKYAFPGEHSGSLRIRLESIDDGGYRLSVSDDGIGLRPGAFEGDSLGLTLVRLLSDQIGGELRAVEPGHGPGGAGTRFVVEFSAERRGDAAAEPEAIAPT